MRHDTLTVFGPQSDRAADARVERHVLGQRRQDDALSEFRLDIDPLLEEVCLRALSRRVEGRHPDMPTFAAAKYWLTMSFGR
jgi:hypothetical protein